MHLLSSSRRSEVQFQALIVLKFTGIKGWERNSPEKNLAFQVFLWDLLANTDREPFVVNKLIELYALSVKRSWMNDSDPKRLRYFELVEAMRRDGTAQKLYVASKVVRTITEMMTVATNFDTGLTVAQEVCIRRDFISGSSASARSAAGSLSGLRMATDIAISIANQVYSLTADFDAYESTLRAGSYSLPMPTLNITEIQLLGTIRCIGEVGYCTCPALCHIVLTVV